MSQSLSVATVIEKNRVASDTPFIVLVEVDVLDPFTRAYVETIRLARNSEDLTYQGNLYVAMEFDIELKQEAGAQSSISLSLMDRTRAVQERMQAYGGGIGSDVRIIVVNAGNLEQPPEVMEYFNVVGASAQDYAVTWELGAESILAINFPKRRQIKDRCAWRYKSAQCGYTGGLPKCDLTLQGANGCAQHANTINFGGFPGINSNGVRYA